MCLTELRSYFHHVDGHMVADLNWWYPWSRMKRFGNAHPGLSAKVCASFYSVVLKSMEPKRSSKQHSRMCHMTQCSVVRFSVAATFNCGAIGEKWTSWLPSLPIPEKLPAMLHARVHVIWHPPYYQHSENISVHNPRLSICLGYLGTLLKFLSNLYTFVIGGACKCALEPWP